MSKFDLSVTEITIKCRALEAIQFPGHIAGTAIRASLLNAMTQMACTGDTDQPNHADNCPVCWLVAKGQTAERERRGYAIEASALFDMIVRKGELFEFSIRLFGNASRYLKHFISALQLASQAGTGLNRGRFEVVQMRDANGSIYELGDKSIKRPVVSRFSEVPMMSSAEKVYFRMTFDTPTRIMTKDALNKCPSFADVFKALLIRVDTLCGQFESEGYRRDRDDVIRLHALADSVKIVGDRRHFDDQVSRSRYHGQTEVGGVVGEMDCVASAEAWSAMANVLVFGQRVGVGQSTVKSCGFYRIERLD